MRAMEANDEAGGGGKRERGAVDKQMRRKLKAFKTKLLYVVNCLFT